jgi:hypothetical protein
MKKSWSQKSAYPFQLIDARIKELGDWRGKMLGREGLGHQAIGGDAYAGSGVSLSHIFK